jgi:nucleoside-diphosphate-sugar epimerase
VVTADLLSRDSVVEGALREADAVIHLAGCAGVRDAAPDAERRRHRDNVVATARVTTLVPPEVPLIVASSSSVYGGVRHERACRESDPPHPVGGYAESKRRCEQVCASRAAGGDRVLVVRPFTVVGEGQRPDMALSRWIREAEAGDALRVLGSLDRTRDFTCVREVARGLRVLLEVMSCRQVPEVVNLGSGCPRPLGALVEAIAAVLDTEVRVSVERAPAYEVAATWADTSRFASLAGFVPETDLQDVVRRCATALSKSAMAC